MGQAAVMLFTGLAMWDIWFESNIRNKLSKAGFLHLRVERGLL
jgi:hypothetical protein